MLPDRLLLWEHPDLMPAVRVAQRQFGASYRADVGDAVARALQNARVPRDVLCLALRYAHLPVPSPEPAPATAAAAAAPARRAPAGPSGGRKRKRAR